MKTLVMGTLIFATSIGFAKPANSKEEFCARIQDRSFIQELALDPQNRMAFRNRGGLFNGGVCWWHSLMQRSAWYLSVYKPELPKPDSSQAMKLIMKMAAQKNVIEIPGYNNFQEFSHEWQPLIQEVLEKWQAVDGFLKFEWLKNITALPWLPVKTLESHIAEIVRETNELKRPAWIMLKQPGFSAHAWLVLETIEKENEIDLVIVDSNFPSKTYKDVYYKGSRTLKTWYYGSSAPYLGRLKDYSRFEDATNRYCSGAPEAETDISFDDIDNSLE